MRPAPPRPPADGSVRAILADFALREQMTASAELAARLVRKAQGRVLLRPEPHRFALFHVLKAAQVPAVLFEAGYVSNADDELGLTTPRGPGENGRRAGRRDRGGRGGAELS